MRGSRKFCQRGSNFDNIFFPVGREDPNKYHYKRAIIGLPAAFRWCADAGPTLNAGLVAAFFQGIQTCIARKPYIFVIFQGGPDPLTPLWIRAHAIYKAVVQCLHDNLKFTCKAATRWSYRIARLPQEKDVVCSYLNYFPLSH